MHGSASAVPAVPLDRWGEQVALARREMGLSQTDLAEAVGVTQQTISKVERGTVHAHDKLKVRLASALGRSPADLFTW